MKCIVTVALLVLGSSAFASECLNIHSITGFNVRGFSNTELTVSAGKSEYKFITFYCAELSNAEDIQFRTHPSGGMQICAGDDIELFDIRRRFLGSCMIQDIQKTK